MAEAVYDFKTALRTDTFLTETGVVATTANETLLDDLYDDDTGSVDVDSDEATDTPVASSYNATSQQLLVSGLTANTTRILEITYAFDALEGYDAIVLVVDRFPFIWMLLIIVFPIGAFAAIFMGRAD